LGERAAGSGILLGKRVHRLTNRLKLLDIALVKLSWFMGLSAQVNLRPT
jgi:hypothetical protein